MIWHPYAETFPQLAGDELFAFEADLMASGGNRDPVTFRILEDGTRQYLDGRNRAAVCRSLGLFLTELQVYLNDDEVVGYIDSKNVHRRHLSSDWRRQRVAELTAEGQSTRAIAGQLGVANSTVFRDQQKLEQAGVAAATPGEQPTEIPGAKPFPATVKGLDGKEQPRQKVEQKQKSGKELFDWREHYQIVEQLRRQLDKVKRAARLREDTPARDALEKDLIAWNERLCVWFEKVCQPAKAQRPRA